MKGYIVIFNIKHFPLDFKLKYRMFIVNVSYRSLLHNFLHSEFICHWLSYHNPQIRIPITLACISLSSNQNSNNIGCWTSFITWPIDDQSEEVNNHTNRMMFNNVHSFNFIHRSWNLHFLIYTIFMFSVIVPRENLCHVIHSFISESYYSLI